MNIFDWLLIVSLIGLLLVAVASTRKYNKSVADFLTANRCAGRYLLGVADGMSGLGAISVIGTFEKTYAAGFAPLFWHSVILPIGLIITLSGFVTYRFRASRAMTLAQFFEMRYSRRFRITSGMISWFAGLVNFGIFPSVAARFFINFCDLPPQFVVAGIPFDTYAATLMVLIGTALFFTLSGGQISVIVTDFWQGIVATVAVIAVTFFLISQFSWSTISEGLEIASAPGKSLIDPFDIGDMVEFSIWYYAILWFNRVHNYQAWQGGSGYNAAAINPHEQKMSRVVGMLKDIFIQTSFLLIPVIAVAVMFHPDFKDIAAEVQTGLESKYGPDDPANPEFQIRKQMTVPSALTAILPHGLVGLFATAMLGFFISTNNTYMHSWGSIFIQDVLMPFRKKPFSPEAHMKLLRLSVTFVALFAFFFSLFFPLREYIYVFFLITGAIYLSGAGSCIIGGMYWRRGTTKGAFTATILGAVLGLVNVALRTFWLPLREFFLGYFPNWSFLLDNPERFPFSGAVMTFTVTGIALTSYIVVSLLDKDPKTDFDKLFHRGKHAVESDRTRGMEEGARISIWWRIIGVNSPEFSVWDKGLYVALFSKTLLMILGFLVLLVLHLTDALKPSTWTSVWGGYLGIMITFGFIAATIISVGGFIDLRKLYQRLSSADRDAADDGWVEGHTPLAELPPDEQAQKLGVQKPPSSKQGNR